MNIAVSTLMVLGNIKKFTDTDTKYKYCIRLLTDVYDTPKCHRSPLFSGRGFILPLIRDFRQFNIIGENQ